MREAERDEALLRVLDPRARVELERLVEQFLHLELPVVSADVLYHAADTFEDRAVDLDSEYQLGGQLFAAILRLRARMLSEDL